MSGALLGKTVTAIAAGSYHTVALTSDGKVFAWGYNHTENWATARPLFASSPVAVDMSGALLGKTVTADRRGRFAHGGGDLRRESLCLGLRTFTDNWATARPLVAQRRWRWI